MSELEQIFGGIANAKDLGKYENRLPLGHHKVAIKRYGVRKSQKTNQNILEMDLLVLESTVEELVGKTQGWAWFINSNANEWSAPYEQSKAKDFLQVVKDSIGDTRGTDALGAGMAGPAQHGRGVILNVDVEMGQPRKNSGKAYPEAKWRVTPQTLPEIAAIRAELDKMDPPKAEAGQQTAHTQTTTQSGASGLAALANLGRK